ncbi:MAG: undecaprenyl-phosphate glucose phosphotransferase [Bacteroidota bacterium]
MIANRKSLYSIKLWLDILLLNLSFLFSAWIAQPPHVLYERPYMFILMLVLNILWYIFTNITDFYDNFNPHEFHFQARLIFKNVLVQIITAIIFIFAKKENLFTRNFILSYFILLISFVSTRTITFRSLQKILRAKGKYVKNLLIVGANNIGIEFSSQVEINPVLGYNLVGFVDDDSSNKKLLGGMEDLNEVINRYKIDDVIIAASNYDTLKLNNIVNVCNKNAVRTHIIPDYFQFLSKKFTLSTIGNFPIITVRNEPLAEIQLRFVKRTFDIFFSILVMILILSWLIPLIAILIKLTSRGPVFFVQDRIGLKNEKFSCYKFRSMYYKQKNQEEGFNPTLENDPRVTAIGKYLRKYNLDELPQFWNIIKGEMSIVGPRPHAVAFNQEYLECFDAIKLRHLVKPGLTGWAQIHGLRGDVPDPVENKKRTIKRIEYDIWYIESWDFFLDLRIIFLTVWQMIKRDTKAH